MITSGDVKVATRSVTLLCETQKSVDLPKTVETDEPPRILITDHHLQLLVTSGGDKVVADGQMVVHWMDGG